MIIGSVTVGAQAIPDRARISGYFNRSDTTVFVFDEAVYGVKPDHVAVTGPFRGWASNTADTGWQLVRTGESSIWTLAVPNTGYSVIPPSTPFKFLTGNGVWMDPPAEAANEEGGNLVFLFGVRRPRLKAEIRGPRAIWADVSGDGLHRPMDERAYRLSDATGQVIPIAVVIPNTASETLVVPQEPLDMRKNYRIEIPELGLSDWVSHDGWFRILYSDQKLGAEIDLERGKTVFRLFAPRAHQVQLHLYHGPDDKNAYSTVDMASFPDGTWEADIPGNLKGVFYLFELHGTDVPGQPSSNLVSDPYARVNVGAFGKSRVWTKTEPARPLVGGIPPMEDVVAYEVHLQDFTDLLPVSDEMKGTLPAMVKPGLTNSRGEAIGFDYLVDLGINVVHLMPIQEYFHYPDTIWQEAFADDPLMRAMGIAEENYQWGYRTTHAMAVETRYRKKGSEHGAQRDQFRDLVQAFHDRGIAVIVDFVFNHTGENMEGLHWPINFNGIDMLYYYRTKDFQHIGAFGNETKSENRPMVQRWIIDQCRHFIEEFGVDGFRIDLAGQTDEQTLLKLRAELGPDIIVYGEPWIGSNDPDYEANPDWDWYKADSPITFFQDDARNAFKGPTSPPINPATDRGFAGGNVSERENVIMALENRFPEEKDPRGGINYLDIHDNWALADRFALNEMNGNLGVDEKAYKLAATLLFTSLGPIVLHGGSEMMRSKGLAPVISSEIQKKTSVGTIYIKGRGDTYNLRVPNQFVWENVGKAKGEAGSPNDYKNMLAFWKGLIKFRLSDAGRVFRLGTSVPDNYYRWIPTTNPAHLGYVVDNSVLVLINVGEEIAEFRDLGLGGNSWKQIADGNAVDHLKGVGGYTISGGSTSVRVAGKSLRIFVRETD